MLYDFEANTSLALLLKLLLKRNPACRCFVAHSRRLGIVCPTSSVPVDVFAEDFLERFCEGKGDTSGESITNEQQEGTGDEAPFFEVYVHPTPPPPVVVFGGFANPAEAKKLLRRVEGNGPQGGGAWGAPTGSGGPPESIMGERFCEGSFEDEGVFKHTEIWELRLKLFHVQANRGNRTVVEGE